MPRWLQVRHGAQLPEWADGWRLELPDSISATLTNPAGGIVYDGECSQPGGRGYCEVGGCIVLIGTVGLFVVPDDECTAERFSNMLNDAAQAGALVDPGITHPTGKGCV